MPVWRQERNSARSWNGFAAASAARRQDNPGDLCDDLFSGEPDRVPLVFFAGGRCIIGDRDGVPDRGVPAAAGGGRRGSADPIRTASPRQPDTRSRWLRAG